MKLARTIAALAVTGLFSTAALAAEADWYVEGQVGASFQSDADTPISAVGITVSGQTDFDTSFDGRLALGRTLGDFRVEVEFAHQNPDAETYRASAVTGAGFGTINVANVTFQFTDTDIRFLSLMVNGWYDFDTGTRWRPYVGGGLGATRVELEFGATDGPYSDEDIVFAWQVGAGIGYVVNDNLTASLGWRYGGSSDPDFRDTSGGTVFDIASETDRHSVLFGLRYRF